MFRTALANYDDANFMGSFSVDVASHVGFHDSSRLERASA
jgi:hypothetical protein